MVVLESNTHSISEKDKLAKMSDSTPKDEVVEEKTEDKPLSNGTDEKKKDLSNVNENGSNTEDKMDVNEEKNSSAIENVEQEQKEKEKETSNSTLQRPQRKSRSSLSQSSNSSSSTAPNVDSVKENDERPKNNAEGSEEEDFLGFDSPDTEKLASSLDQLKKADNSLQNNSHSTDEEGFSGFNISKDFTDSKESGISNEKMNETPTDTASVDSESYLGGSETPSSSIKRGPRSSSKKSVSVDLSSPLYKKPFDHGWVRELVYRSTSDSHSAKRNADIYYYTPTGKKVRSCREILEHLTGDLTIDNFTFFKEPVGINDPTREIIREAKTKPGPGARGYDAANFTPTKKLTPKAKVVPTTTPKVSPKESPKTVTPKVVFRPNATPKNRGSTLGKSKLDKKRKSAGPDDVDIMVESSEWSPDGGKVNANGMKRSLDSPADSTSPPEKKSKSEGKDKGDNKSKGKEKEEKSPSATTKLSATQAIQPISFMMNLNAGFVALLNSFQYLRVYELLRAARVSRFWNFVASHHSLWETVRMKNSKVSDWEGFGRALASHGTKTLDLRKMLVPESPEEQALMWVEICKAIRGIKTLTKVDLGRCNPSAFTAMAEAAPQLESLVSLAVKGNEIDLKPIVLCKNLKELKLKAVSGGLEIKELACLKDFPLLTTLALTTVKNLKGIEDFIPKGLINLELGECSQLSEAFATQALSSLVNLKRLRLEKGQNECPTMALLDTVSSLPHLTQLELINFDIKPGFEKGIAKCTNLRTLLIIPTYVTQSATTNHVVMGGVAKLSQSLTYFIWGLTLELLKVTDLFIGQVESQKSSKSVNQPPKKGGAGDSIPILKPSPSDGGELKEGAAQAPSQVDILALPNLQRVLSSLLPTTKIKILKVPFSATWRQTVTDN